MLVSLTSVIFALCMYYQIIIQLLYMQDWVAISFSRGSSWHGDWTWVSCIAGRFFTIWDTREALIFYQKYINKCKKFLKNLLSKPYEVLCNLYPICLDHLLISLMLQTHSFASLYMQFLPCALLWHISCALNVISQFFFPVHYDSFFSNLLSSLLYFSIFCCSICLGSLVFFSMGISSRGRLKFFSLKLKYNVCTVLHWFQV